jgi:hypothetical protein
VWDSPRQYKNRATWPFDSNRLRIVKSTQVKRTRLSRPPPHSSFLSSSSSSARQGFQFESDESRLLSRCTHWRRGSRSNLSHLLADHCQPGCLVTDLDDDDVRLNSVDTPVLRVQPSNGRHVVARSTTATLSIVFGAHRVFVYAQTGHADRQHDRGGGFILCRRILVLCRCRRTFLSPLFL